jgi:hypothetical protein
MRILFGLLIYFATSALAANDPITLPVSKTAKLMTGTLYSLEKDAAPLFKFKRTQTEKGTTTLVDRSYLDLQGVEAVHEKVIYENQKLSKYTVETFQTGDFAEIELKNGKAHFYFKTKNGKEKREQEDLEPNTIIGEQIPLLIDARWDELLKGESVPFRLLVEDRLETVGFKLKKDSIEEKEGGKKVVTLKMVPTSFFIQLAVKPLYFVIESVNGTNTVLEYRGRTKPRKRTGTGPDDFDALDTRTVFERI